MSWWVSLNEWQLVPVEVEPFSDGGTRALGGETEARINVTYNYSKHFDFKVLDGKRGAEVIALLEERVAELGTERDDDYWKASPGNVGAALNRLLSWALQHPNAIFTVH